MENSSKDNNEEVKTTVPCCKTFTRCYEIVFALYLILGVCVAAFGNSFLSIIYFFGLPGVFLLLRYLWLRLIRDPFLSPSDTFSGIFYESITTCPPNLQRTAPTIVFVALISLEFLAFVLARVLVDSVDLNWFVVIFDNAFGSLLILVCAVWLVDALWLAWLFIVVGGIQGKRGAAQNWWWKGIFEAGEKESIDEPAEENETVEKAQSDGNSKYMQFDEQRRLARMRTALAFILYIWWTVWALAAAYNPHTLELSVPIPRLPPQCDGYRLAVATDLHAGALAGAKDTEMMVNKLNSLSPDASLLVGDIGDTAVNSALRAKLAPLANLEAPDGAYLSFGNHEYMHNIEDYRNLFRVEAAFDGKVSLLENEHVILNRNGVGGDNGCSIMLVGMADWSGITRTNPGQIPPDIPLALSSTPARNGTTIKQEVDLSSKLPMIMMQHQPAGMVEAAKAGVGLQISGHTHGGQLWPQHGVLWNLDAISGLHSFDVGSADGPSYLFVSEGIVGWGPRLRFLCKTDLAVLTLRTPSLMEAEGDVPDTRFTVATYAMYASYVLVPLGVIFCSVPYFCRGRKWCRDRRTSSKQAQRSEGGGQSSEMPCNEETV